MSQIKFLIVEDDINFSRRLKKQLMSIGYHAVSIASNMATAINAFNHHRPDIIIMDIQLPDAEEGGIELTKIFNRIEKLPIIYYSQYLKNDDLMRKVRATNPVEILDKASSELQVKIAIENVIHQFFNTENTLADVEIIKDDNSLWLISQTEGIYKRIFYKDICWLASQDKKTIIVTENERITFGTTLTYFEKNVAPPSFQRIHKSFIINFDKSVGMDLTGRAINVLRNGKEEAVSLGEKYITAFKNRINLIKTR